MPSINELREQARALLTRARAANEGEGESKGLTTEERSAKYNTIMNELDKVEAQIAAEVRMSKSQKAIDDAEGIDGYNRKTQSEDPETRGGDEPQAIEYETRGFGKVSVRPNDPEYRRATDGYREEFRSYLRNGRSGEMRHLVSGSSADGGYTAPVQFVARLLEKVEDAVTIRRFAMNDTLAVGTSLGYAYLDAEPNDAEWTAEVQTVPQDTAMKFGRRELQPHLVSKRILVSRQLLRQSAINVEDLIIRKMAYKFGITENKAFLTGDGSQKPLGVFTASSQGISTGRDVVTGSTTAVTDTGLFNAFYGVKSQYQNTGVWIMHRAIAREIRKLKDVSNGGYLWSNPTGGGLTATEPPTLLGRPVFLDENAPNTFSDGNYAAIFGDFGRGYHIVTALNVEMQRLDELYAQTNQVSFINRHMVDGMPVLEEAFSRLKFATS